MVTIIFEAHSTTTDNENHISSGQSDVELSELGITQSHKLGERYKDEQFNAIFCSDLRRSFRTAEIAFANRRIPIVQDARLRECDYGDLTNRPSAEVDREKPKHITIPFPRGESYEDTAVRMKKFLVDLLAKYDGKKVMIVGHRATQYGLDHWILGKPVYDAVTAHWQWQPGWKYELTKLP